MLDKSKRNTAKDVVARIPRKSTPKRADKLCKPCEEYGGAKNTHHTSKCKKWAAGGKSHNEWNVRRTTNLNVHQDLGVNQLLAQRMEFQKSMMKEMSKMKKTNEERKRKRSKYYSDSDSSDSD